MTRVAVVGSANVDTTLSVERIPAPGQTVLAHESCVSPGGKGLNQAIASHKAGAETTLIAAVGSDLNGTVILRALEDASMRHSQIRRLTAATGLATVAVDDAGENAIIVLAGANGQLLSLRESDEAILLAAQVVLCQLEVPLSVVLQARELAARAGAIFVLNPSPVRDLPRDFLLSVDIIVVNEHEAAALGTGALDVPCVVETLGSRGAIIKRRGMVNVTVPSRLATVVDTTGAGDTFVGTLAAELARGADVVAAARRAVVAGSLAVESRGAVLSIPTRADVDSAIALLA